MLTRAQILDEAQKQKQALATMGVWRKGLFVLTTVLLVFALFGLRESGPMFLYGMIAAALAIICFVFLLLVNLSIRNGHRNVERMLDFLKL